MNTTLIGAGILSNDWDPDGGTLTASVVANPGHGTLSSFNGSTGAFTFVPTTGYVGLDSFTYKINDGSLDSNIATVNIAIGGNFGVRTNLDEIPRDGMLHTGGLTVGQPLVMNEGLVYRSESYPRPVVTLETSLLSSSAVPTSIDAQLTFGGIVGSTVSYSTTGLTAGSPLRFVLQVDASSLSTGYYDYTLTLTAWIGGTSYARAYTGSQAVVNRSSSEFGGGWWLDGLDKLVTNTNGALLVQGNGDTLWFSSNGSGGYNKAAGDSD